MDNNQKNAYMLFFCQKKTKNQAKFLKTERVTIWKWKVRMTMGFEYKFYNMIHQCVDTLK